VGQTSTSNVRGTEAPRRRYACQRPRLGATQVTLKAKAPGGVPFERSAPSSEGGVSMDTVCCRVLGRARLSHLASVAECVCVHPALRDAAAAWDTLEQVTAVLCKLTGHTLPYRCGDRRG
jgi:hypothetical protein